MYKFDDDLQERALHFYTLLYCGEFDEDFYFAAAADAYFDETLGVCITLDYLDRLYEIFLKSSPIGSDQYKKTLASWNEMDYTRIKRG